MHSGTLTNALAMATTTQLQQANYDPRPPTPPTSPPPLDDEEESIVRSCDTGRRVVISEATRLSLRDIHFIDSSSGSEDDGAESGRRKRCGRACEGGEEAAASGEDAVLIRDEEEEEEEEVRAAEGEAAAASASGGGDEHTAAPRRSRSHDGGGRAAVVSALPGECVMQHKCGVAPPADTGEGAPPEASMAASDAGPQQPQGSGSAMVTTSASGAPLRSALKRAGQKSKGHRVSINEAKNECLEADYVILVHEENEPQLVSIRSFDLSLLPGSGDVEQLTLSPPEGYKDCFSHAVHETIVDDSGVCDLTKCAPRMYTYTESGSGDGIVDSDAPRPHLPDLVTHQAPSHQTQLTVENVRHHDQLMQGKDGQGAKDGSDAKVAKTGILKGGKLWKNGDGKRAKARVEVEEVEEPQRRSVRFSGRDEYSLLENLPLDKIPLDAANSAALAKFMPKLRELGMLLGESEDWHVELSPVAPEATAPGAHVAPAELPPPAAEEQEKQPPPQMDDEQIGESMRRYEEMRRRIAAAEGRSDNTSVCSDESKSSSDSQSSDSTMTETRIRRLENSDVANVAGGVMRSNSEVRRAIERNALRRSLIRFSEARKKDTNKNDKNERGETSLLEKLKWLTASEDATNGNSDDRDEDDGDDSKADRDKQRDVDPKVQETIAQYRKLAEMFNKTTSLRANDILVPGDVREWKLKADLFPEQKDVSIDTEPEEMSDAPSGAQTPTVFKALPAVSLADLITDEENDKLIYSGGVRYTREGTLPTAPDGEEEDAEDGEEGEQQQQQQQQQQETPLPPTSVADARKQFLSQMAPPVAMVNGVAARDRSSVASNSDSYTFDDIDEALHDDRSSSVPSSSQSSPRLSGRSDVDGTSTTESGYSSNETNGELCPVNGLPMTGAQLLGLPVGGVDIDELAEFVRQDAGRIERLRRRYDAGDVEDHGFNRRPSVRGIKPRFGSTTDLLKQMATQLAPPTMAQSSMAGSHMTWPYRESGEEDASVPQRRRAAPNRAVLPALQEDILYVPTSDLSPQAAPPPVPTNVVPPTSLTHTKAPRVVHVYSSTGDLRAPPPPRAAPPRESPPPDLIRPGAAPQPPRAHTHAPLPQHGSVQSLVMAPQMPAPTVHDHHYQTCRRPASVHGHVPADALITRGVPPPPVSRPHSTLSHYPPPRVPVHYHPYEEPPLQRAPYEGGHPPLAQRGSYPGTVPAPHYQPSMLQPDLGRYPHPPAYGSQHPHARPPVASPREGVPYSRTPHPQAHPQLPQVSPIAPGPVQVHQCGPRHPPPPRMVGGAMPEQICSTVWSHHPQPPHIHQSYPPHPVSSHLSYTTPIVPESGLSVRPSSAVMGPPIGPPLGPPLINGNVGKLEGLRDERGVPEGASSSPRGPIDPQYPSHTSPTREASLLHRHPPPPMNMT